MNEICKAEVISELMGIKKEQVFRLAREKRIPSIRLGRQLFFVKSEVENFLLHQSRASVPLSQFQAA